MPHIDLVDCTEGFFENHLYTNWYKNLNKSTKLFYNGIMAMTLTMSIAATINSFTLQFAKVGLGVTEFAKLTEPLSTIALAVIISGALLLTGFCAFLLRYTTIESSLRAQMTPPFPPHSPPIARI